MKVGIPTKYNGVQFRSRLEARWAAFLDLRGVKWTYEPEDFPGWIPDFAMVLGAPKPDTTALVEVKPIIDIDRFILSDDGVKVAGAILATLRETVATRYRGGLWIFGMTPNHVWFWGDKPEVWDSRAWTQMPCESWMDVLWKEAGNLVQWRAPR